MDIAAQVLAALSRARQARQLAELVSVSVLSGTDQCYLAFEVAFERQFLSQRVDECRDMEDTLERAWRALAVLPRRELVMLGPTLLDAHRILTTGAGDGT
jgi:V/A-type H+-transporting ATPase subunit B